MLSRPSAIAARIDRSSRSISPLKTFAADATLFGWCAIINAERSIWDSTKNYPVCGLAEIGRATQVTIVEKTMRFEGAIDEPRGSSVYGFEERCIEVLSTWMSELGSMPETVEIEVPANALTGERLKVAAPAFRPTGRPLILIEPHCDDLALSFLGTVLQWQRPVTVVTLFNRSRTLADGFARGRQLSYDEISALRRQENEASLGVGLGASCHFLDLFEAPWPWSRPDISRVDALAAEIAQRVDLSAGDLAAPAGLSKHPDHYLARAVSERLGCRIFWEDVGFFREYARCEEDRAFGRCAWPIPLREELTDLGGVLLTKLALLLVYRSQVECSAQAAELLRYHWALARNTDTGGDAKLRFAERVYFQD